MSDDKDVYIMGDFNIDLLKCETSQVSQDFLLSLRNCYLIPTVDKPTRLHRTSATLVDNIFVNNPNNMILVITFPSFVSQRQRKINFDKLKM